MSLVGLFVKVAGLAAALLLLANEESLLRIVGFRESMVSYFAFAFVSFFICCGGLLYGKRLDQRSRQAPKA